MYHWSVWIIPGVSGSPSKNTCLQVLSSLQATVIKFPYETSLVSLQYTVGYCTWKKTVGLGSDPETDQWIQNLHP